MTKLIFALRAADHARLLHHDLRAALGQAGAERLQVNLDDDAVAPAMRLAAGENPVSAVVSVWLGERVDVDAGTDAVLGIVLDVDPSAAGWEVEERTPIVPPETADGARTDALANVALLRRPPGLDVETWRHRWLVEHTPVAIATQATFGYVQNVVTRPLTPTVDGEPVAAIVEELFPTAALADVHAFYGSGGDDAELADRMTRLMTSVSRMGADQGLDLVPTSRYVFTLAT